MMGYYRAEEVNSVQLKDCVALDTHYNSLHMPCWVCNGDQKDMRHELLWNDEHKAYFHRSCLEE